MQLRWYGTAALILQEDDTLIAFDPFCGLCKNASINSEDISPFEQEFRKIKNVFITHGHFDHIARIPAVYKNAPLRLWCTRTPYKTMLREGVHPEQMQAIRPGERINVGPFTVTAYQSRHCKYDLPIIIKTVFRPGFFRHPVHLLRLMRIVLRYPENKETLFYEVLCGDKRIQIMGSLNLSADIKYPTRADVLVLPFQGRSDLEKCGLSIVQRLKPRRVLLDHYDDSFPPISNTVNTKSFKKLLREQEKIPCKALEKGVVVNG